MYRYLLHVVSITSRLVKLNYRSLRIGHAQLSQTRDIVMNQVLLGTDLAWTARLQCQILLHNRSRPKHIQHASFILQCFGRMIEHNMT